MILAARATRTGPELRPLGECGRVRVPPRLRLGPLQRSAISREFRPSRAGRCSLPPCMPAVMRWSCWFSASWRSRSPRRSRPVSTPRWAGCRRDPDRIGRLRPRCSGPDGRNFRMRSRWMLVIVAMRRATPLFVPGRVEPGPRTGHRARARARPSRRAPRAGAGGGRPARACAHHGPGDSVVPSGAASASHRHHHRHRHVLHLSPDPLPSYGPAGAIWKSAILHGVGAETPTKW